MKLRIKGNSMRLRVTRSEFDSFTTGRRIEETIHFGPQPDAILTYALQIEPAATQMAVTHTPGEVVVRVPSALARNWVSESLVGLSHGIDLGPAGTLELLVEKDFACLDQSEADNEDTFPHPSVGAVC